MSKSARAFRRVFTETLPVSGQEVELRKVAIDELVMQNANTGDIPQPIVNQVMASLVNRDGAQPEAWEPTPDDMPRMGRFIQLIVKAALLWPKIVERVDAEPDYDAGEIAYDDLETADRMYIFKWAMPRQIKAVESFRQEPGANVEPRPDGEAVRAEAE